MWLCVAFIITYVMNIDAVNFTNKNIVYKVSTSYTKDFSMSNNYLRILCLNNVDILFGYLN